MLDEIKEFKDWFLKNGFIDHPVHGKLKKFKLTDSQEFLLNQMAQDNIVVGIFPRQVGVSTILSAFVYWKLFIKPSCKVLFFGYSAHSLQGFGQRLNTLNHEFQMYHQIRLLNYNRFKNGSSLSLKNNIDELHHIQQLIKTDDLIIADQFLFSDYEEIYDLKMIKDHQRLVLVSNVEKQFSINQNSKFMVDYKFRKINRL